MDPAHQKTYISTPHMTENDNLNFWPPRQFDGVITTFKNPYDELRRT